MDAVVKNKTARFILLGVAIALIVAAAIWGANLERVDPLSPLVDTLNSYGYSLTSNDIFVAGETQDTTISELLAGIELADAVEASTEGGFPSDVNARGTVILMLAELDDRDVITVYLRDEKIELCFIQNILSQQVRPLGTEGE